MLRARGRGREGEGVGDPSGREGEGNKREREKERQDNSLSELHVVHWKLKFICVSYIMGKFCGT